MHEDYQKYKKLFKSLSNKSSNELSHIKNHPVIYGKTKDGMSQSLIYFLENSKEK